jgi:trehalose 6-phosphate synthase/phosphatase
MKRIKRYDVYKWASDFIAALKKTSEKIIEFQARKVSPSLINKLKEEYNKSEKRVLFLDYDGTLQRFFDNPEAAVPDKELYDILDIIAADNKTELVLISGRDKVTFDEWFGNKNFTLIAEHGAWFKEKNGEWIGRNRVNDEWKEIIMPILESYVDRTPGSLIETKSHSLVWHYRKADIELGALRALELSMDVSNIIINQDLEILEGNKVIEVKVSGINKGSAATEYLKNKKTDYIMAVGDDWTDEFLFKELPESSYTIKVGSDKSVAKYYLDNYKNVRELLKTLIKPI